MAGPDIKNIDALPAPIPGQETPAPEPDTKKLDALLASLNGSAERFQTLWFSFLGLTLYLAIAALATTHRDLLLNNPQILPILNIKVELLPFYVIAPLLYLVFHFYLLMMLALLARTAAEFDKQLRTTVPGEPERERYRAQVGNALFLQLLVGMKGERTGVNALLMGLIALITIVLAPLATLVLMQMMFLPYHHLRITWWHRGIVVADLVLIVVMMYRCFFPRGFWKAPLVLGALSRKPRWATAMVFCLLLAVALAPLVDWLSFRQGRWAGEPRAASFEEWRQWMAGAPPKLPDVNPDYAATENNVVFSLFPDRLRLPDESIVGKEKLDKTKEEIASRGGEFVPTIKLDERDPQAADFSGADLRGVSLNGAAIQGAILVSTWLDAARLSCREQRLDRCAQLQGANLGFARLQGANLLSARLQDANLGNAQLQRADLRHAQLQGASLRGASLQGANLGNAQLQGIDLAYDELQGANLGSARLQGANLSNAHLEGSNLSEAELQSADLSDTQLQGGNLRSARLQGASLKGAQLQGADLSGAQLQGANLGSADLQGAELRYAQLQGAGLVGAHLPGAQLLYAQLQGADFSLADLADSDFTGAFVFRTGIGDANLATASIRDVRADQVKVNLSQQVEPLPLIAADVDDWIAAAMEFATENDKEEIKKRFDRLKPGFQDNPRTPTWVGIEEASLALDPDGTQHRRRAADRLGAIACGSDSAPYVARGLIRNGRLAALRDQVAVARTRMEEGR